ncbi:MAG: shikimate kinase [Candidatus Onthomonas sp.]
MKNVILIGMMGCGKTTCGRLLSKTLGMPLVDTDELIQQREGCTVSEIFERKGEAYFRALETSIARELGAGSGRIIATGGGMPLRAENRAALRQNGVVFFLNRSPEEIYDSADLADRPLAQQGRADFIRRFQEREPVYREAAHYVISDASTPRQAVEQILADLKGVE